MIKKGTQQDSQILAELAAQLWSGHSLAELRDEFEWHTEDPDAACFIKYVGDNPIGFAQCQLRRDYVEGTNSSPVGYLEGILIMEKYRHQGYAKELLSCCEEWALNKNCTEFASDCEIDNFDSLRFHLATGFEEAGRIICFKKLIKYH